MSEIKYHDYSNEKVSDEKLKEILSTCTVIKELKIEEVELLQKNANVMTDRMMNRLIENIKRDGKLTQLPFMHKLPNGRYEVISGNHRIMAAKKAGLTKVHSICCEVTLPKEEKLRIQISHNSIKGEQQNVVLLELANEFHNTEVLRLSGIDFDLAKLNTENVDLSSINTEGLEMNEVLLYFTDYEIEKVEKLLVDIERELLKEKNQVYILEKNRYDKFVETIIKTKQGVNIKSNATIVNLMIDFLSKHRDTFIDELKPKEKKE